MNFLIDQIKEQKILEMEVNFEDFIQEHQISETSIIYAMEFDKDVFADEKEVREYLKDKYFYNPAIIDQGDKTEVILVAPSQVDQENKIVVELRRGVTAHAADLLPVQVMQEINFNAKGEFSLVNKIGSINLHEGLPHIIEIARVAEGEHPSYGKLQITQENLESFVNNFKSNVTGVDLAVNEDHRKNEAFGWFKDVFLSFDKQTAYGQVQWNSKGIQALSEKEYRYFSPEFRFNYVHPHTGESHGPTLLGGALTNYPFLKMEAITELNNKETETKEKKMNDKTTIDLSVHNQTVVDLNTKITEANGKAAIAESKIVELNSKVETLEKEINKAKIEKVNETLFNEGKINKAQLVALNEGKGMLEVLALNEKINTEAKGTDEVNTKTIELSNTEKKLAESLGLTEEEFQLGNK